MCSENSQYQVVGVASLCGKSYKQWQFRPSTLHHGGGHSTTVQPRFTDTPGDSPGCRYLRCRYNEWGQTWAVLA
jgi:hypothetical protein